VGAGQRRLAEGELVFALDVAAARLTAVPLEFPMSPTALSILSESQRTARNKRSHTLETSHLLVAALGHGGPRVAAFLSAAGMHTSEPSREAAVPCSDSAPPRATLNYRRCIDDARAIASDCGAGFLEEEHLLYAVLLSASRGVDRELSAAGLDRKRLLQAFRKHFLWTRDLISTEYGGELAADTSASSGRWLPEKGRR